ncbi:response regulator [Spirosoma sp. KCTC 42546]|uniref:response regulator n=1 Tax=Spirosoma sp. KCTC 42546 TaxID=2520506 RepID=UPI001159CD7D|nr:response regulator [Spirosoma sp. KCTC 42546]QDK79000.1 response regulator [Spirosoma sp. KCTC 42546]
MTNLTTSSSRKFRKATILVVEDNADQWFIIHWALLQRFPEVEAIWMQEPAQAIMYLEACKADVRELPKLILLDLYLPQRQMGWQLLEMIKAHYLFREIPVVILSQSSDPEDISESYSLRSNSYIVKPMGYEKWLDCIASFRHYWWEAVTLPKYA